MLEGEAAHSQEDTVKSYEYPVAASRHGKQLAQLVERARRQRLQQRPPGRRHVRDGER